MADPNIEAFTLLALGLAMIGLARVGVRWSLVDPSSFQLDDYLMPLAGVIFILETVAVYLVGSEFGGLTNSYMSREQRAALNPVSKEYSDRVTNSKLQVIGWSFYAAILWLAKASLAVFYSRLTTGLMYLPIRNRVAYIFIGVTYISTALSIMLGCQPISKNWQINPDPGNLCQPAVSKLNVLVVAIPNVLTDLYLLAIRLPLLWRVNMSVRRKITLMALFSGAIFVILATIIRAVVIIKAGPEGAVSGSRWACRETFVAIIVSNLPIIQPLIRKAASTIGLSAIFHSYPTASRSHHFSSKGQRSGGYELRNRNPHPLSISQATAWGSNEHILGEEDSNGHTAKDQQPLKEITVVQETVVKSEPWPAGQSGPSQPPIEAWTHKPAS